LHAILGYLIADLGVRLLPAHWADRLGIWLARVVFELRPRARSAAEGNLGRLRPHLAGAQRRLLARRSFEHFALCLLAFLRLRRAAPRALAEVVHVRGRRHLDAALAARRGVILLSAHVGDWELGAAFVAGLGTRLHVLARPHPNRWVERLFQRTRHGAGVHTLGGHPAWRRAAEVLRRGDWVAVLGDRPSAGAGSSMCAWAAALARRTGAVLLPGAMVRVAPGRYAAYFRAPLTPAECGAGGFRDAMRPYLSRYPGQWCAFEALPKEWA
jgi:KDO2-lipid IV(A) lauroyltransferase